MNIQPWSQTKDTMINFINFIKNLCVKKSTFRVELEAFIKECEERSNNVKTQEDLDDLLEWIYLPEHAKFQPLKDLSINVRIKYATEGDEHPKCLSGPRSDLTRNV